MGAGAGWRHRRGCILVLGPRPAALPALPALGAPRGPGLVPLPPLWPPVPPERPAAALSPGAADARIRAGWRDPFPPREMRTARAPVEPSRDGSCAREPRGRATPRPEP